MCSAPCAADTFQTLTHEPKDTSAHGIGRAHRYTGMVRTAFLPSDDSPRLAYHVPGNAFAVVELRGAAAMLRSLPGGQAHEGLASDAEALAREIDAGIKRWGIVQHMGHTVYAMEVDGYGNYFFGDDANVPSLISLPLVRYLSADDPTYRQTRQMLLSGETNPYFYGDSELPAVNSTAVLGGIGSEDASGNAGLGHIWPLGLITRLMTVGGADPVAGDAEVRAILRALVESSGGTGLMHESYWFTDASTYTRYWFAMANSYLGEALLRLAEERPSLLFADAAAPTAASVEELKKRSAPRLSA